MSRPVIFVTGAAHSGKTEVARALGADPGAVVVRRAYFWRRLYGRFGDLGQPRNLTRLVRALGHDDSARSLGIVGLGGEFPQQGGELTHGSAMLEAMDVAWPARPTYVIQLGGIERLAPALLADLPGARIIHLVRDPRMSLGVSDRRRPGRSGWELARWSSSAAVGVDNATTSPDRYLLLRSEELFEAGSTRRLADFTGLEPAGLDLAALAGKSHPVAPAFVPLIESLVSSQLADLGFGPGPDTARRLSWRAGAELTMFHLRSRLPAPLGALW